MVHLIFEFLFTCIYNHLQMHELHLWTFQYDATDGHLMDNESKSTVRFIIKLTERAGVFMIAN